MVDGQGTRNFDPPPDAAVEIASVHFGTLSGFGSNVRGPPLQ
jgi:hypothetical protein